MGSGSRIRAILDKGGDKEGWRYWQAFTATVCSIAYDQRKFQVDVFPPISPPGLGFRVGSLGFSA